MARRRAGGQNQAELGMVRLVYAIAVTAPLASSIASISLANGQAGSFGRRLIDAVDAGVSIKNGDFS